MKLKAFLSDLDGTLIDTRERAIQAHAQALRPLGYSISPHQIRNLYRYAFDSRDFLNRLNVHLSDADFIQYLTNFREHFFSHPELSNVIPGAPEVLSQLQNRTNHMRVITSRHDVQQTRQEIRRHGLHRCFEAIYTRGDLAQSQGKERVPLFPYLPQRRALIQLALQDVKADGEVWVVGDSVGELEAAKSLGCVTIGVLTGFGTPDDLAPFANHVLNSFAEIVQLI
jgi:phosphoglycolate phosphatase-like HAD superfamily hydrolase